MNSGFFKKIRGLSPAAAQHLAPATTPGCTMRQPVRSAKFDRTAHPRRPGSSLPLSSPDTAEGSAHGNNPENRARKASRKNSDMFSESGLYRATVLLPVLLPVRVQSPPPPLPGCRTPLFGDVQRNQCAEQCSAPPRSATHAHRRSVQRADAPETAER